MKYSQKNKLLTGFTIIEMLVVISIISIIATSALNFSFSRGSRVEAAAEETVKTINTVREWALLVQEYQPPTFSAPVFPQYGLQIDRLADPRTILLYADCKPDDFVDGKLNNLDTFRYIPGANVCEDPNTPGNWTDGFVENRVLSAGANVHKILYIPLDGSPTDEKDRISIEFVRPEPTVWFTDETNTVLPAGAVEIEIEDATGQYVKTILIRDNGLITKK